MWRRLLYRGGGAARSRHDLVAGRKIHARVVDTPPDAPPVVLVHGIGVSSRYLMPTAVRLAPDFRAFVPDLPGFGRSPGAVAPRSLPGLADLLAGWLEAVGIERPPLVANSFGCQIVVELAVRRPERVAGLVLVGPTIDRHARSFLRQAGRLVGDSLREPPGLLALIALDYPLFALRGGLPLIGTMLADEVERKLPLVTQPALVVRGSGDGIVSQRWAEEVANLLPNGRLEVVEGAPHAVNYAAPEALARLVRAFLGTVSASGGPGIPPVWRSTPRSERSSNG